ncbi:unnamed protein product [Ilex paraguariensis]|uniref:Disease resistance R13L4/SHOC-2-like LRR domain-containing protein n=1 Tax=Ilex paraguariensis TaxID=185542 RepID=A0ABC8S741_9AQUA
MQSPQKVRRLAIHHSFKKIRETKCFERLRSLLMFENAECVYNSSVSSILSGGSKLLRVLDLRGASLETFPHEVCELVHLRYLSIRGTHVRYIPASIGKLRILETLDLKHNWMIGLPIEIGKLEKLRYLVFNGVTVPAEIGNLSSLQKLARIAANQVNGQIILGVIGKLTQLKSLKISKLRRKHGMILCPSLKKLSNLRSLSLSSLPIHEIDIRSLSLSSPPKYEFDFLDLKTLSLGTPFLRKLYLEGHLEEAPAWISSLHSLVKVRLSSSRLRDDLLTYLQDLPNLQHLELHDNACKEVELCFKAGGFKSLQFLWLEALEKLRWVKFEQGAMPHLENLIV